MPPIAKISEISAVNDHAHELTLGLAFFLSAFHALEPGPGKTAMLVFLSGERRGFWQPLIIGLSNEETHSVSLLVIAFIVHVNDHVIASDRCHDFEPIVSVMQWISGLLMLGVGVWLIFSVSRAKPRTCGCNHHQQHACETDTRSKSRSYSMSALLGVAFSLLPTPVR